MSIEENKQVVRRWFEAVNRGDEAAILAVLAEDFAFEAMLRKPEWLKSSFNRAQFAATPAAMSAVMESPITMQIISMIGEGDIVTVEASTNSHLKNGKVYDNAYHFAFVVKDGKISRAREYSCSYLAAYCFAEMNPWKDEQFVA